MASRALTNAGVRPEFRPTYVADWRLVVDDTWSWALSQTVVVARSGGLTVVVVPTDNSIVVNGKRCPPHTILATPTLQTICPPKQCHPVKSIRKLGSLALALPVDGLWYSRRHDVLIGSTSGNKWLCPQCNKTFARLEHLAGHYGAGDLDPPVNLERVWSGCSNAELAGPVTRDWNRQAGWPLSRPIDQRSLFSALAKVWREKS